MNSYIDSVICFTVSLSWCFSLSSEWVQSPTVHLLYSTLCKHNLFEWIQSSHTHIFSQLRISFMPDLTPAAAGWLKMYCLCDYHDNQLTLIHLNTHNVKCINTVIDISVIQTKVLHFYIYFCFLKTVCVNFREFPNLGFLLCANSCYRNTSQASSINKMNWIDIILCLVVMYKVICILDKVWL